MAEGIKSLATTAGYFAPGAGILDALGMYPAEGSASMLQNLKAGEFGTAGLQGLGALGAALMFTGVGAPLGMTLKTVSKSGKIGQAGRRLGSLARQNRTNIFNKTEPTALTNTIKIKGDEIPLDKTRLEFLTPKLLKNDPDRVKYSARALDDYATKNRSIAGRKFDEGGTGKSKYFMIEKNVGLGVDNPAKIAVRISDHAPTKKGVATRGGKEFMNADVRINVGPKGHGFEATTLDDAIDMIENMHIKPGNVEDLITQSGRVSRKHLGTAKVVDGRMMPREAPLHWYRGGGQLPFGLDGSKL